jgi:outer membrane receptor protein involved in Fe transport
MASGRAGLVGSRGRADGLRALQLRLLPLRRRTNVRVGFRAADGWTLSVWARNLLNEDYYDLLSPAPGNTGLYVGQPGDPRTFGVTMRVSFRSN